MPTTYAIPNGRTVMDATTYTGTGTTQIINNSDNGTVGFKPDLFWLKNRSGINAHYLYDSVRGPLISLSSNDTSAEQNVAQTLTSFNSNGATLGTAGGGINGSGNNFVAWQWQAGQGTTSSNTAGNITSTVSVNATAGFSVVTFAGSNVNGGSIGHGLGVTPAFFIIKARNSAQSWGVYHQSLTSPNDSYLLLNTTDARASFSGIWTPSSTTITFPTLTTVTNGPFNYVVYCWAPVAGFSQFGSYTGNGSTDGVFVYTGFRPKFILIKNASITQGWNIQDTSRSTYNIQQAYLQPQDSAAESAQPYANLDFLSNGFKLRSTDAFVNGNGNTMIYAAFAENPFKYANAR